MNDRGRGRRRKRGPSRAIREPELPSLPPPDPAALAEVVKANDLRPVGGRPPLGRYVSSLWQRRAFMWTYARSQVRASNAASQLGGLWVVLNPILNAAVYYLIFGIILGTSRGIENFIAFLVIGVFVMNYTARSMTSGANAIMGNLNLIRALHFPRAILPMTVVLRELLEFFVAGAVMVLIVLVTGEPLSAEWLALPAIIAIQTLFNLGLCFTFARLTSQVRDVKNMLPFVTRTWTYLSGVMYSIDKFTDGAPPWAVFLLQINPAHVYIELMRDALMQTYDADPTLWFWGIGWALFASIGGFLYFWRGEETYGRA